MNSKKIVIGILLLSIAFNIYQWKTLKSNKQTEKAFMSRNMSILGSDFIQARGSIEDILTEKYDRGLKFGIASAVLMDASFRANEPFAYEDNYLVWHKIGATMERANNKVGQLVNKATLDENDVTQLNDIKQMLDVYIEMMQKSNANTGYIDDQSLLKAEKAADQFNE
ncbi:hypothetical protein [Paenibacillus sp. BK720]|uniref:hypothetical protein n=1 Tax=Paenibacillus sp. BK720 TaxID=2587092 RepID=UPI00141DE910|nr:hypothetical protein [Paenibacillus sp. BK720]NIK72071.1 hypothetical protein [Paenibacillus sp. BK720]